VLKYISIIALVCGFASASFADLTAAQRIDAAAQEKYNLMMNGGIELWDLQNGFAPVYYGEMKNTSGGHMRCLALAFMHSPKNNEIHYVFKTWPANGSSCDYGDLTTISEIGKPACLPDPTYLADRKKGTRDMRPQTIGKAFDATGVYGRILDFDQNGYDNRMKYGRAGLLQLCSHPAIHQGVLQEKGTKYTNFQLGNTIRELEITSKNFFMETNTRQYEVSLDWVNTADTNAVYPRNGVIPNR